MGYGGTTSDNGGGTKKVIPPVRYIWSSRELKTRFDKMVDNMAIVPKDPFRCQVCNSAISTSFQVNGSGPYCTECGRDIRVEPKTARIQYKTYDRNNEPHDHAETLHHWIERHLAGHLERQISVVSKVVAVLLEKQMAEGLISLEEVRDIFDAYNEQEHKIDQV